VGFGSSEVAPSPKSHLYVSSSPSASLLPSEEKATFSGACPLVRSEDASATGLWPSVAFSIR
jgi:hypothetical protein